MTRKPNKIEKLTVFKTPEESPGYLLWRVSTAWRSAIEKTLKPLGLTHPQFVVLTTTAWLTRNDTQVNQIDVGESACLDPNTVSQILRGLEAKRFIIRTRSLNERSKNPQLTKEGLNVLASALPAVERADAEFFSLLSEQERATLIKMFQKFAHE